MKVDERIAKDFLGLDVQTTARGTSTIGEPYYFDFAGDMRLQNPVPLYSEDIAAAWPLLLEMNKKGWAWRLDHKGPTIIITVQRPVPGSDKRKTFMIEAVSAPAAICEAALKIAADIPEGNVFQLPTKKDMPPDGAA